MESRTVPERPDPVATPAATISDAPEGYAALPPTDTELLNREVTVTLADGTPLRLRWRDVIRFNAGGQLVEPPDTLDSLAREIQAWQAVTFPHCTAASSAHHLAAEAEELVEAPTDPGEQADIFLLLIANSTAAGTDLVKAVRAKLEKNKRRTWGKPNGLGIVQHIAEGPDGV